MIEKRQFYINGKWINSVDGRDYKVINPSTEEPVAVISLGGQADTNASVAAAKAAFPAWMATSIDERLAILENLVEIYKTRKEDLAQAMSLEMGAPIDMARTQQVEAGLGHLRKAGASVARAHAVVGSAWEARLKRSGFRAPSKEDTRPIILRVLDPAHPLTVIARDPKSWYFTDGDRDAELIG